MVMTILEAHVDRQKWSALEMEYNTSVKKLDAGIVCTYLIHSKNDGDLWRILTLWESREVLDAMRQSGETPRGVLIFRAAGAQSTLTIFDVISQAAVQAA